VNTNLIAASLIAPLMCSGGVLAQNMPQDQPRPPSNPAPEPAPAPAPDAAIPSATSPAEALAVPGAQPKAVVPFADGAAVDVWMETYYQHPEPGRVLEAFQTLARTKSIGVDKDHTWAQTAFFWACMRENAASMAEWCATIGHLDEPAKTWWWTAVWMSQTVAGNEALQAAASLPEGHVDRVNYNWLRQKPQDIMQTSFRGNGKQHVAMLWHAFYATGSERMIFKMYEGFVPVEPKEPKTPEEAKIATIKRERNKQIVENTRLSFAQNLPKHSKALQICKDSIPKLKDPVKSEIEKLVTAAEAAASAPAPAPDAKPTPDAAPAATPDSSVPPSPEPGPEPAPEVPPTPAPGPR
jgi:hypothetical protein